MAFAVLYHLPLGSPRFDGAVHEALALTRWYAREHVLLCLVPGLLHRRRHLRLRQPDRRHEIPGRRARRKVVAYGVASVSGTVLAVCSCTVLPLFAGIYGMGAGIGPATAFLYSGPGHQRPGHHPDGPGSGAGHRFGARRRRHGLQRRDRPADALHLPPRPAGDAMTAAAMPDEETRPLYQTGLTFLAMVAILVFANWGGGGTGFFATVSRDQVVAGRGRRPRVWPLALVTWYGLPWWKPLLIAGAGLAAGFWLGGPAAVFTAASVAFAWAIAIGRRRTGRVVRGQLGVRQADPAPVAGRCPGRRPAAGQARTAKA